MGNSFVLLLLLAFVAGCGAEASPLHAAPRHAPPPRPALCRVLPAGSPLQAAVDAAAPGEALCLEEGSYDGPVRIERPLVLWGSDRSVIRSKGVGTTVEIRADGSRLLGLTVDGSGGRFDTLDAAVRVEARDVTVEGVTIANAIFGILVEKSRRVVVRNNRIYGDEGQILGMRGDSIRFWEAHDSVIEGNDVSHGRDVVIWYARNNVIRGNTIRHSRYGSHLMWSHGNVVEGNRYVGNVVGIFLMYSRDVGVRGNVIADSSGSAGIGLGLKEAGDVVVEENLLLHNTVGLYLDTSPLQENEKNTYARNVFRLNGTGVVFHSSPHRNALLDNDFADNLETVRVDGGGDALGVQWLSNYFDQYGGYDLDEDGIGDVPFELRSLSSDLTSQYPSLVFFRGAPALRLVNLAAHVIPLIEPKTILRDPVPRMRPRPIPVEVEVAHAD